MKRPFPIDRAVDVFVGGFTFTRSFTYPYISEHFGAVHVMHDEPRRARGGRNEEWVAHGVTPESVDALARQHSRGRFAVCPIHANDEPDAPLRAGYKALGYRLGRTEPLLVHDLKRIPRCDSPAVVERVMTQEVADHLAKAARSRQILPEHFAMDSRLRQYVALVGGELAGWVRSIVVGKATWCSNMFVEPRFRRRGIARALLSRMLQDDRANGATAAVLLASHMGAKLYPVVGYRQIGTLLLLTPRRR